MFVKKSVYNDLISKVSSLTNACADLTYQVDDLSVQLLESKNSLADVLNKNVDLQVKIDEYEAANAKRSENARKAAKARHAKNKENN